MNKNNLLCSLASRHSFSKYLESVSLKLLLSIIIPKLQSKLNLHIKFWKNRENEKFCVTIFCFVSAGSGFEVCNIKSNVIPTRLKNLYDQIIALATHQISKTERKSVNGKLRYFFLFLLMPCKQIHGNTGFISN